jgi:hypothetical protein
MIIIIASITSSLSPQLPGLGMHEAGQVGFTVSVPLEALRCLESTTAPMPSTRPQSLIGAESLDNRGRGRMMIFISSSSGSITTSSSSSSPPPRPPSPLSFRVWASIGLAGRYVRYPGRGGLELSRVDQGPDAVDPPPKPDRGPDQDARGGGRGITRSSSGTITRQSLSSSPSSCPPSPLSFRVWASIGLAGWSLGILASGSLEVSRVDQGPDAVDPPPKPDRGPVSGQ